jgi:uncharacterized protein YndB with AHSA1/START domain
MTTRIEFPNDLEIAMSRDFVAPRQLVFDVLTKPEHLRKTIASFGERVTTCELDLRVGGDYHYVFVTDAGYECSFRGTFLEVDAPNKTVETWRFDGWPDALAVKTMQLVETDGITTYTWRLAFRDAAGRARMTKYDGPEANLEILDAYLKSLVR